jgi:hypothetical protein
MPIISGLEFVQKDLTVAYRASAEPQRLEVLASIKGFAAFPFGPISMLWFERGIRAGGAGGAEFAPTAGIATHVSGPLKNGDEGFMGPDFRWELEVASVSPYFLRNIVSTFSNIGAPYETTSVSILGSLPVDDSPLSVRESDVKAWLEDDHSFMKAWADPGFPLKTVEANRNAATVRLVLDRDIDKQLSDDILTAIGTWNVLVDSYPNLARTGRGKGHAGPRTATKKREMVTTYDEFDYLRDPSQALLSNVLSHFHAKVCPIREAEISLPEG